MTRRDDRDDEHVIVDRVVDAVVPDVDAESVASLQRLRSGRAGVLAEQSDGTADPVAILMVDLLQCSNGSGAQFDPIAHVQPRSAFT